MPHPWFSQIAPLYDSPGFAPKAHPPVNGKPAVLPQLMAVIHDRKVNPPARSYTTTLLAGGVEKIGEKIVEEAHEVVQAAGEGGDDGRQHLVHEAADLVYHLCVLLGYRDVGWEEIELELGRRCGICGLDEKESRHE